RRHLDESARGGIPILPSARGSTTKARSARASETRGSERSADKRSNTTDQPSETRLWRGPGRTLSFYRTGANVRRKMSEAQFQEGTLLPETRSLANDWSARFQFPAPAAHSWARRPNG